MELLRGSIQEHISSLSWYMYTNMQLLFLLYWWVSVNLGNSFLKFNSSVNAQAKSDFLFNIHELSWFILGFRFQIKMVGLVIKILLVQLKVTFTLFYCGLKQHWLTVLEIWLMRAVRLNHTMNEWAKSQEKQNELKGWKDADLPLRRKYHIHRHLIWSLYIDWESFKDSCETWLRQSAMANNSQPQPPKRWSVFPK